MSHTLSFIVSEKEIDSSLNISDDRQYSFDVAYNQDTKGSVQLTSGTSYTAINFAGITTALAMRISSDQALSAKLNGGTSVLTINKDWIICGAATALSINNASGTTANVIYEVYG